jgi:hypothetical protein
MWRDVLRFLWTAFFDHWATWVTGTGVVGLLLWALNYFERVRGTPMKLRTNALILFCTFWFFATFAAWHDADTKLEQIRQEKTHINTDLVTCRGDLKSETGQRELLDGLLHTAQNNFNSQAQNLSKQQQTMDSQQLAMNSCVVALGKANTPTPQHSTVALLQIENTQDAAHRTMMIVFTNQAMPSPVKGIVGCEHPFKKFYYGLVGTNSFSTGAEMRNGIGEWQIITPQWTPTAPLLFTLFHDEVDLGSCGV